MNKAPLLLGILWILSSCANGKLIEFSGMNDPRTNPAPTWAKSAEGTPAAYMWDKKFSSRKNQHVDDIVLVQIVERP